MKTHYPLYNKIYNKMKTISKKLDLQFDVEHSIKINYKKFNDTRFIFILSNYNDSNIIQKNISYIKNTLSLSTIPQYKKGHIIQFIYGIDIEDKRTKVYITVAHSKNDIKSIIYSNIYKNNNFTKRYYLEKDNFYKKYPNSSFVKFFDKINIYNKYDLINNYYLIYQNNIFHAISLRTLLLNNKNSINFILSLFKFFKLHLYNQNIILYLNKYKSHYLTNITINNTMDEINLYFNI